MNNVLGFFNDLKENNNKEWFNNNKNRYLAAKAETDALAGELIVAASAFIPGITELSPKDCTFRIYRDVRFSKDKTPYKTNAGIFLVPGGKKSGNAGYYLHIEVGNSFIGGGVHMPLAPVLKAVRTEIYNFPEDIQAVLADKKFKNAFGQITGDKLVNPPKGFDKDFELIDLLKFKSYTVATPVSDNILTSDGLVAHVTDTFKAMQPFVDFLNRAIREN